MSDAASTLLAVVVGGALTVGGSIISDWLNSRRARRLSERDRLRDNLYELQDGINAVFDAYQVAVESKNGHGAPWTQESNARLSSTTRQLLMQLGRVGDGQIDFRLTQVLSHLRRALDAGPSEADAIFKKTANTLMPPLAMRIEELLHTGALPDRKSSAWSPVAETSG